MDRRFLDALLTVILAAAPAAATLPPPNLEAVIPDRAEPGESVTLTGSHLGEPGDTVEVIFSPGVAVQAAPGGSTLQVTVPAGAETGTVRVRVTRPLPGGGEESAESFPLPFQVVWRFFDLRELAQSFGGEFLGWGLGTFLSRWDDAVGVQALLRSGSWWASFMFRIGHPGQVDVLHESRRSGSLCDPCIEALRQHPLTGHVWAKLSSRSGGWQRIADLTDGHVAVETPTSGSWFVAVFDFDPVSGELVVAAHESGSRVGLWRGPTDAPWTLDENGPYSLIPGGSTAARWWLGNLAVAADGTIYAPDAETYPGPAHVWRIPGRHGEPYEVIAMPPSTSYDFPGYGWWTVAADCHGEGYAANPCLVDIACDAPLVIFRMSDLEPIAQLPDSEYPFELATDAYANLYLHEFARAGHRLRRILPSELPPGFYGYGPVRGAEAQRMAVAPVEAPPPGEHPLVRSCRGEDPPPLCRLPGFHRTVRALADVAAGRLPRRVDLPRARALAARAAAAQAAVVCPIPNLPRGYLVVDVVYDPSLPFDPSNGVTVTKDQPQGAEPLLGQLPELRAFWFDLDTQQREPIAVRWRITDRQLAAGVDTARALYPDHPAFLFGPSLDEVEGETARLAALHLGTVTIEATPLDPQRAGEGFAFPVEVTAPSRLGSTNNRFDQLITDVAHRYGIPPHYLKGQVDVESAGTFNAASYRYEPISHDELIVSRWPQTRWNDPRYEYYLYRMPDGPGLTAPDRSTILGSRPRPKLIERFDGYVTPPAYTCRDVATFDLTPGPLFLWDLWEADEGWPRCSYMWMLYNDNGDGRCDQWDPPRGRVGPCGVRSNWLNVTLRDGTWNSPYLTYSEIGSRFFCSWRDPATGQWSSSDCTASDPVAVWLLNHLTYPAQTAIAASYGLLQVMYTTAVERMEWKKGAGRGLERHPSDLLDPAVSLDLGAGYDAWLVHRYGLPKGSAPVLRDVASLMRKLGSGIQLYTGGGRPNYWSEVQARTAMYPPLR